MDGQWQAMSDEANEENEESLDELSFIQALSESIDPVNLGRLAGNFSPKSSTSLDTILFDGDTIFVPKNPNSIIIIGEVLNPVAVEYTKNITNRITTSSIF